MSRVTFAGPASDAESVAPATFSTMLYTTYKLHMFDSGVDAITSRVLITIMITRAWTSRALIIKALTVDSTQSIHSYSTLKFVTLTQQRQMCDPLVHTSIKASNEL